MLYYLILAMLCALMCSIIGGMVAHRLRLVRGINSASSLLLAYVLGLLLIIMGYAIFKTHGASINVLLLLVLLVAWYYAPKVAQRTAFQWKWRYALGLLLSFFLLALVLFEMGFTVDPLPRDHHFLTTVSYYMDQTGHENEFHALNLLSDNYHGSSPYHYAELWLNAALANTFDLNYNRSLKWLVIPLLYYAVFLGLLALYETVLGRTDWKGVVLSLGMVFFFGSLAPVEFLAQLNQPFLEKVFDVNLWIHAKEPPYLLFGLVFLILWERNVVLPAYFSLLFVAFLQFTCIPAVLGFLLLHGSYHGLVRGKREEKLMLLWLLGFAGLFLVHKTLWGNHEMVREATSMKALAGHALAIGEHAGQRVNVLMKEGIYLLVKYHLLIVAACALSWVGLKRMPGFAAIKIMLGISVMGLLGYMVLFQVVNAYQLYLNFAYAFVPAFIFWATLLAAKNKLRGQLLLRSVLVVFLIVNMVEFATQTPATSAATGRSAAYLAQVQHYLNRQEQGKLVGGSLSNTFESAYYSYVTIYTNGAYLSELRNGACTISLSDGDVPRQPDPVVQQQSENGRKLGWLTHYIEQQTASGSFVSYRQSQLDLLMKAQFPYIICSPTYPVPKELRPLVQKELVDSASGERFLMLEYPEPALAGK